MSNTSYLQGKIDAFNYIKESLWIYQDGETDTFDIYELLNDLERLIRINEKILDEVLETMERDYNETTD